jgi:hypothetical protein
MRAIMITSNRDEALKYARILFEDKRPVIKYGYRLTSKQSLDLVGAQKTSCPGCLDKVTNSLPKWAYEYWIGQDTVLFRKSVARRLR